MEQANSLVKISFRFYSEMMEQEAREILTAATVDAGLGHYSIHDIPLYMEGIATGDIVYAEYIEDEAMLLYKEKLQASGNSTIWVAITDDDMPIDEVRDIFNELGCESKAMGERYFGMEVKASANFLKMKDRLNQLKANGIVDYMVPCLSGQHV